MEEITFEEYKQLVERQARELLDVIQYVALGKLDVEIPVPEGIDVLSDLAIGIEIMVDDIRDTLAELEAVRTELEQRVAERIGEMETALIQAEALYAGSERVIGATTVNDVLQALVSSTALQRLAHGVIQIFDRPWGDEPPRTMTVVAAWERSGEEPRLPIGTSHVLEHFPATRWFSREEPRIVRDIVTDEHIDENTRALFLNQLGIRSIVIFPLVAGEQWIGILAAQDDAVLEIDEAEIRTVTLLISQAAAVVQNLRLIEQTQAALAETEALYRASRAIGEASSAQEIVHGAAEIAASLGFSACSLTLITAADETGLPLRGDIYSTLIVGDELTSIPPISDFSVSDRMAARHALEQPDFVLLYTDSADLQAPIPDEVREVMNNMGMRGMVTAGLSIREQPLGFLTFSSAAPLTDFPPEHVRRIRTIADQVAIALASQRLLEEAQTRARREQILREITARVRGFTDPDAIVRATVRELGVALGRPTFVRLGSAEELSRPPTVQAGDDGNDGNDGNDRDTSSSINGAT